MARRRLRCPSRRVSIILCCIILCSAFVLMAMSADVHADNLHAWTSPQRLVPYADSPKLAVMPAENSVSYINATDAWGVIIGNENRLWNENHQQIGNSGGGEAGFIYDDQSTAHAVWVERATRSSDSPLIMRYARVFRDSTDQPVARDLTKTLYGSEKYTDQPAIAFDAKTKTLAIAYRVLGAPDQDPFVARHRVMVTLSPDHGVTWSAPQQVGEIVGYAPAGVQLITDSAGHFHILYGQQTPTEGQAFIYHRMYSGGAWTAADEITGGRRTRAFLPSLAAAPNGDVWATWIEDPQTGISAYKEIGIARWDSRSGRWTTWLNVSQGQGKTAPAVTVGSDGAVWAIWGGGAPDFTSLQYRKSADNGASWSAPQAIFHGEDVGIAHIGTSNIYSNSTGIAAIAAHGLIRVVFGALQTDPVHIQDRTLFTVAIEDGTATPDTPTPNPHPTYYPVPTNTPAPTVPGEPTATPSLPTVTATPGMPAVTPTPGTPGSATPPFGTATPSGTVTATPSGTPDTATPSVSPTSTATAVPGTPTATPTDIPMTCHDRNGTDYTDQYESDDSVSEAVRRNRFMQSGVTEQHTLCQEGKPDLVDTDIVLITAQAGQTYSLSLVAQHFVPKMSVGIVAGATVGEWTDCNGDTARLCVSFTATTTGTYYARISDAERPQGRPAHSYSLSLFVGTPPTIAAPTATRRAAAAPPVFGSNPAPSGSTSTTNAQGANGAGTAPPASSAPATDTSIAASVIPGTPTLPALVFGADAAGDQASGLTPRPANTGAAPTTTRGTVAATTQAPATTNSSTPSPAEPRSTTPQTGAPTTPRTLPQPVTSTPSRQPANTSALIIAVASVGGVGILAGGWGIYNMLAAMAVAKGSAGVGTGAAAAVKTAKGLKFLKFKRP